MGTKSFIFIAVMSVASWRSSAGAQTVELGTPPAKAAVAQETGRVLAGTGTIQIVEWYDTTSRSSIRNSWNLVMAPTFTVPTGWTGSFVSGNAGDTSPAWKDAVQTRINYYRTFTGIIGVDPGGNLGC